MLDGLIIFEDDMHENTEKFNTQSIHNVQFNNCLLYTSPSPRDATLSRMPSSA